MQPEPESEHFVLCSERTVLECECGERLVLLGLESDWHSEGRTIFNCECGRSLTIVDNLIELGSSTPDEETRGVRDLLRSLRTPDA